MTSLSLFYAGSCVARGGWVVNMFSHEALTDGGIDPLNRRELAVQTTEATSEINLNTFVVMIQLNLMQKSPTD